MSTLSAVSESSSAWAQMSANRSQMQAKMFAKVDADSSGGVNQTELQGLLDDVASKTGVSSSTKTSELFSKMDGNGDGSLSSDELAEGMASILQPPSTMEFAQSRSSQSSESGAEKFAKLDADGSGTLSKDEMLNLMTQKASQGPGPGQTSAASTDEMFAHLDSDGDGSLTQAEFDAGAPPTQAQASSGTRPPGAGRSPPPPPGGGRSESASSSTTTYDSLDLNQDGTVSEAERLIGELTQTATESTSSSSSVDMAKLAKTLYDQIAASWAQSGSESSLSVTA
ncbi:EF-hand domain-containing protein [Rhodoferax sp. PAMC 29310]|uniref:EF-hand domain-containing protein n=1 Tax=Rhodoferax sp. PAMC 29310 TaxID=2822760 RepID=UPI001B335399|nr:EF-hand domain-containing protein [Rhodoferax sp. PAMC 29310]